MSDVQATTQTGAAAPSLTTEDAFQRFFDAGGLNDDPPRQDDASQNAAQTQQEGAQQAAQLDQGQQTQQQDASQQQDDTPTYASLSELLSAHKIDPESAKALHVTTKIDGVESQVPLAEIIESFQLKGHVNNKSIELSNQRTAFEQERQAVRTMFQQQLQQNQALGNLAHNMLMQDFQRIDWNGLRQNNPAEFAALQTEFQQRQAGIQNYMQQVNQQAAHEEQQRQHALSQSLAGEQEKLMNAIPAWRDEKVAAADRQKIATYARERGFQDAELGQIYDHRYMLILRDAALYRELQASSPQVLKQVRQAPPMAAPGSRQDVNPREAQRKNVIERFNRNPRDSDAQLAAFEFLANQ
ncbi:hypothetical protein [Paraburkholderia unamae]|uniref:Uncharacterized protein n=1 Tax=Paraburkholderia unamae TaxID=219649 RepID=A0ABX5KJG5_9BURK|nr:hypothetical protein [Paraburkholderia unamae]PVX77173.1 hypothetical protein C7402_115232 [Paraburkholderia unamae]